MARALFVYWKVPGTHAALAIDAARAMQDALAEAHPGLQAQLFQRADDASANASANANADTETVTVMETYGLPNDSPTGIGTALQAAIAAAAATRLAGLPIGQRHVEVFDRLPR